jgi:DNA-binding NarL/FixJ family response regulator
MQGAHAMSERSESPPLRILYVEDDPALRGILSTLLRSRGDIIIKAAVDSSAEALRIAQDQEIDVALLDVALGQDDLTGIELGMALRRLKPHIGIVLLSQHHIPSFLARVDESQRKGWSFILKRADLHPRYLSDVIHATARGLNVVDPGMVVETAASEGVALLQLSDRQLSVMALAAQGLDSPSIAAQLGLTAASVRQDLSRAYQVLVPDPPAGADLRTLAVIRYLRETRSFSSN